MIDQEACILCGCEIVESDDYMDAPRQITIEIEQPPRPGVLDARIQLRGPAHPDCGLRIVDMIAGSIACAPLLEPRDEGAS